MHNILPNGSARISDALSVTGTGHKLFQLMRANNLEGIVAKRLTGSYNPRVRWLKIKNPNYSQNEGRRELFDKSPRRPAVTTARPRPTGWLRRDNLVSAPRFLGVEYACKRWTEGATISQWGEDEPMLRPVRTVRVTTKEEFDAALATADQITVEGDDKLLSYAVNRASGDPENRVAIELAPIRTETFGSGPLPPPAAGAGVGPDETDEVLDRAEHILAEHIRREHVRAEHVPAEEEPMAYVRAPARRMGGAPIAVAGVAVIFAIGAGAWVWFHIAPRTGQRTIPTALPAENFWAHVPSLLWPLVAIVAIVALFLIARQAISSGSNVTIQWKVTEKVSGRVVITKVRERTPKQRAAA